MMDTALTKINYPNAPASPSVFFLDFANSAVERWISTQLPSCAPIYRICTVLWTVCPIGPSLVKRFAYLHRMVENPFGARKMRTGAVYTDSEDSSYAQS